MKLTSENEDKEILKELGKVTQEEIDEWLSNITLLQRVGI
jgi:hypothetical protein